MTNKGQQIGVHERWFNSKLNHLLDVTQYTHIGNVRIERPSILGLQELRIFRTPGIMRLCDFLHNLSDSA